LLFGGVPMVTQLTNAPRSLRILSAETAPTPPPTATTYYSTNFSSGTAAPLSVYAYGGGSCAASSDYTDSGSARSLKCTIPAGTGAAALEAWFGRPGSGLAALTRDPTLDQDFYQQIRFVIGAGSIAAAAGGQFKTHKSVYGQVGSNINGWVMSSFSPRSGEGLITEPELWTNSFRPNPSFTTAPTPHFAEGVVYDVIYYYRRNTAQNCGVAAMWVNGDRRLQTSCLPFLGPGGGLSSAGLVLWDGATYLQDGTGTFTVYNLFTRATNFPIGAAAQ
jgi:hypothetical protein